MSNKGRGISPEAHKEKNMEICRGTTPSVSAELPFDTSELEEAYLSFAQNGRTVFEKDISDMELSGETLTVRLSQADSLKLSAAYTTQIQLRCVFPDGSAAASEIVTVSTGAILKDGVI